MPARWLRIREGVRPHGAIDRERLFERLDSSRSTPLLWVVGDDSLGKSTLLATYVAQRELPCLWLDLRPQDADPGHLFAHFAACLNHCTGMEARHANNVPAFARRFFSAMLRGLPSTTMIVLDGCESLAHSPVFPLILREALAVTPATVQWCLINGNPVCDDLADLVTLFQGERIGPEELCVSEAEVLALMPPALRRVEGLSARLTRDCGGSIGALATILATPPDAVGASIAALQEGAAGARYLSGAQALLAQLPERERDALMALALLDMVTGEALSALVRDDSLHRRIKAWCRRDVLFQATGAGWRLHPLARAMLREMSASHWSVQRLLDVQSTVARYCERRGRVGEAIDLYRQAGVWDAAAGLILREAEAELALGRWNQLRDWIESMPDALMERMPMLRYWLGMALVPVDRELARLCFRRAHRQFEQADDACGQALCLAGMLHVGLTRPSEETQLADWVTQLDPLVERAGRFPSRAAELEVLRALITAALWSATAPGGLSARTRRLHELIGAFEVAPEARLRAAACLVEFYAVSGHPDLAGRLIEQTRPELASPTLSDGAQALWHWVEGLSLTLAGTQEAAISMLTRAIEEAHEEGMQDIEFRARQCRAMQHALAQRVADAQEDLRAMQTLTRPKDHAELAGVAIVAMTLARAHGNDDEALRQSHAFMQAAMLATPRYLLPLWGVVALQTQIEQRADIAAGLMLAQLEKRAQHFCHAPWRLAAVLLRAELLRHQDDLLSCRQVLAEGLSLAREHPQWVQVLRPASTTMARLLAHALEQGVEAGEAEHLVRKLALAAPSRVAADWPWRARLRTLGGLEWGTTGSGRHLLAELVAAGNQGVPERELIDSLFAGVRFVKARAQFQRLLAGLNEQLGGNECIRREGRLVRLSPGHCWVDAWAFVDLSGTDPARALALYRGPLLPSFQGARIETERARLHGVYVELVCAYAQAFEEQKRHDAALALYRAAIEVDGACEVFYQGVMRCELQAGRIVQARRAYELLVQALAGQAGGRPSGQSEKIRERIDAREHEADAARRIADPAGSE